MGVSNLARIPINAAIARPPQLPPAAWNGLYNRAAITGLTQRGHDALAEVRTGLADEKAPIVSHAPRLTQITGGVHAS